MSKTTGLLEQAQPYLRDRYASVRDELGPRIAHTRDVAVPVAMDVSHKAVDMSNRVRSEYLPVATKRAMLAAAVLRGAELERQHERNARWRLLIAATAAGAALGAGAYMWQRKRSNDNWYEEFDDSEDSVPEDALADPATVDHR